ncbi:F-box/kelch-repeat protein At1g57790-like [Papaver somniferum]|uniref:F-box/kelch-repeat protein At1g57790-like n=1 Tax=Papaver somniferum TaxID=3469 RepID=UPI000E6F9919|nr:F-box/kelch-repeat protein At1g57790-like [Papaver somniferum]XP_026450244.1 F-box/kelch-repeat protein At1g57790-like [Papaver somniferum]XP_026450245.1 F-box/kelch-repeat protein At1g57790-like [Papaver somniferum]XP_026453562.1 F-box/kelch-repeat protein At1g57790-like [Papaver somniferum]
MQWKEVSSFGDHVLFSGKSTTACCSAAELGFNRGCLYYTLPEDQSLYKFELEGTGTVTLPCLKLPTPCFSSDWIMMPTTFRVGEQERSELMLNRREERDFITSIGVRLNNKCENQGEVNQQGPWSILQDDTLLKTASYLHPIDYKQFRLVCKAIRSNLPIFKQTPTSGTILSNRYVSPWLVFSVNNECTVYNFVDPMHNNENYFMERPLLKGAIIRFQKDGWLLMSEGAHRLFFHNPFTKETINIPDLPQHYHFSNISFFSLPTCSDCVVYGIQVDEEDEGIRVYIIARGEKSWRDHMFDNIDTDGYYMPSLNTPVLYKGILYSVDYNGLVGTLSSEDNINWSYQVVNKPRGIFDGAYPSFLVECGGDLLLVKLGRMGVFKGIFRLNFSKKEWVRVKSLGKHMLFISYTSCVSRIAPRADMENKIYFSRLSLHGEGILLYSLDTGNYHSLGNQRSSKDFYDTKGWASWSWIEPNWSRSTSEELDWFANLS